MTGTGAATVTEAAPGFRVTSRPAFLGLLCAASFMLFLDTTAINVAAPSIQRSFDSGLSELQWVVNAYTLAFAGLLLGAGVMADRLGRRRVLLIGLPLFTAASVACALAPEAGVLVAARFCQGVGAAVVIPVSLSAITELYPDAARRATAVGIWSGVGAVALAVGPIVGGALVEAYGWRSVFWLNLPIGLLVWLGVARVAGRGGAVRTRSWDLPGQVLFCLGVGAVTLGLVEGAEWGWTSPATLAALVAGPLALVAFVSHERTAAQPIVPVRRFAEPGFLAAHLAGATAFLGLFALIFLLPILEQLVLGRSTLETGLRFLPLTVTICLTGIALGLVVARFSPRVLMAGGLVLMAGGFLVLSRLSAGSGVAEQSAGLVLIGVGVTLATTPGTLAVLAAVGSAGSGAASGVVNVFRQVGGALGVAAAGAVLASRTTPAGSADGGPFPAAGTASSGAPELAATYFDSFGLAMTGAAVICLVVAVATRCAPEIRTAADASPASLPDPIPHANVSKNEESAA